jgi:transcriptional regulator with XRE-family HTH domain
MIDILFSMGGIKMTENIYKIIGRNIKNYRLKNNITQSNLSELSGYSHEFIRRIEAPNTKSGFSIEALYQISKALNINICNLFKGVTTNE